MLSAEVSYCEADLLQCIVHYDQVTVSTLLECLIQVKLTLGYQIERY